MTHRVVVVGAGPAGFAVCSALLADAALDVTIDLVDREELPDGMLRHGPSAGESRLRGAARDIDAVLTDVRVTYVGGIDIGTALALDDLRPSADAVVLATGAPGDLPLTVAGRHSVGIGTISHVEGWLAGNADVDVADLDLDVDTAVLIGASPEAIRIAEVLCGRAPAGVSAEVHRRLAGSKLRHVQVVDPREGTEIALPQDIPANLVLRASLTPIGVVGRNRARALRCLHRADQHGRVVSEDLRAQLLLRPRARRFCWAGLDEDRGHIAQRAGRALRGGVAVAGLYVAGWVGRTPESIGSHAEDAVAVVAAVRADLGTLPRPQRSVSQLLADRGVRPSRVGDWSAVTATEALWERFAGEGKAPLADYQALLDQSDED